MAFVLASKKKKIPSIQSMKNIRKARESTRHEKAWMSRASRFLASHTFSLPTLHTLSFLAISRTPRFLVPHVSSRLELSREERLLLRAGIMQNFCYLAPRMMCHTSQCRFKIQYFPELATLLMESRAVQSSNLFHALLRAFSAGWYLKKKQRRF